jgi:hypothetical protein
LTFTKGVGRGEREKGSAKSLTEILSKPRWVNPLLLSTRRVITTFHSSGLARRGK